MAKKLVEKTCKHCDYLLRKRPNVKVMHFCAVDGKDIVLKSPICDKFKEIC